MQNGATSGPGDVPGVPSPRGTKEAFYLGWAKRHTGDRTRQSAALQAGQPGEGLRSPVEAKIPLTHRAHVLSATSLRGGARFNPLFKEQWL